jgi:[citrate (pro-3S)-lyase] ligase
MGMRLIVENELVSILESSSYPITDYLYDLKKQLNLNSDDIGAIVVNCNPMTIGHLYLIEQAAKNHQWLLLFVLQENRSDFSTEDRFALVKLGVSHLSNVIVLPSSPYLVSNLTFPSYFLKEASLRNNEYANLDAQVFKNYFMPILNIKHRYIGTESHPTMQTYNNSLKSILGEDITEIKRITLNGEEISASKVRKLLKENRLKEALQYVPLNSRSLLTKIYQERNK